jgi:RNA polymerase sigma-70 factor (ECF subfamily)
VAPWDDVGDAELVERILRGEGELFDVLFGRYRVRLYRYLLRYVGDPEDARDVTQEVFLKVWGALDSFDPRYRFSTWAFRIAGNAGIDHLRRRKVRPMALDFPVDENGDSREPDLPDHRPDPLASLETRRMTREIDAAIQRLPDDYRELLSLRHYGEMPYEEIAELKGMPLGTVKNKLFRARQALRDLLPKGIV